LKRRKFGIIVAIQLHKVNNDMKIKDYFKILGVPRTASTNDIKLRYKELVKIYHPDVNPGSEQIRIKFEEITEAYKVLGNLQNRLKYSLLLHKTKKVQDNINLKDYEYRQSKKSAQ